MYKCICPPVGTCDLPPSALPIPWDSSSSKTACHLLRESVYPSGKPEFLTTATNVVHCHALLSCSFYIKYILPAVSSLHL